MRMNDPGEAVISGKRGAEGAMPYSLRYKGLDQDEIWKAWERFPGAPAGQPPPHTAARESLR